MSFSDLMSSGRGPGVIGMLLALVVMAGFGLLFLFAFDDGMQGADMSIEAVLAQQAKDIGSMQASLDHTRKSLEAQPALEAKAKLLKSATDENMVSAGKLEGLRKTEATTIEAIDSINAEFEKYKNEYRAFARAQAKGEEIPKLTTLSGKIYEEVKIREVNAVGMQIRHKEGPSRIPYEDLPEDMQDRFQFDPKQKQEAIAAEADATKAHNAAVAISNEEVSQALAAQAEKDRLTAKANAKKALVSKKAQIVALKDEIQRNQRAIELEAMKSLSRAPQMRKELALKINQLSTLQSQVTQLEAIANQ